MIVRIQKALKFWVIAEMDSVRLSPNCTASRRKLMRAILHEYETLGLAMRRLDSKGRVQWKATRKMRSQLREQKLEAAEERGN